jgi:hypothetical protein
MACSLGDVGFFVDGTAKPSEASMNKSSVIGPRLRENFPVEDVVRLSSNLCNPPDPAEVFISGVSVNDRLLKCSLMYFFDFMKASSE